MEDQESSVLSPICVFLKKHRLIPLVIQTVGNPFLIGVVTMIDDYIAEVHEEAGYITLVPVETIVEVHTSTG